MNNGGIDMAKRILFQGDSITDCGRKREDFYGMGTGYPLLVKGALGFDAPGEYEVINRGIGGNRIVDLYARIKADFTNLKPDYLSIYIGVNDTWHEIAFGNGVDTDKFERIYAMLLDEITSALDMDTEQKVLTYLMNLGVTCIVSTHRPSVLTMCTHAYRVEDGKIAQLTDAEIKTLTESM